ncbi:MAG TPA: NlpC/P60 family protein [Fimbriimonadaceae bacterium]|nr:NlpC/P60 family protein [Fimbriimonadaceae bacterium]
MKCLCRAVLCSSLAFFTLGLGPGYGRPLQKGVRQKVHARNPKAEDRDVASVALRYIGTPYVWGGDSLTKGIDTGHFAYEVLRQCGYDVPRAPVLNQEAHGRIVHYKPGQARRGGKTIDLDAETTHGASTDLKALRPGDRLIFQRGLTDAAGSRHTAIFLGRLPEKWRARFGDLSFAFIHASASRGVTVGSLMEKYYWGIYRYAVRDEKLPSRKGAR